jgi:branched-chain amino acid transport system permease protein
MTEKRSFLIGQRPQEVTLAVAGDKPLDRRRLPFTRRHLLKWRSRLNPKTLAQERMLADKKPLWWTIALTLLVLSAPFLSNSGLTILSIFCIFSAINVLWTLIIGTAGIFSLATLAVVGIGAYVSAALNVYPRAVPRLSPPQTIRGARAPYRKGGRSHAGSSYRDP